jgi:pyruvate dehydrogenase E1 component alpha subunit
VYRAARRANENARSGGGPTLIETKTMRMEGHAVHDDASYVPREMHELWAQRDPIERYRRWLREHAAFGDDEEEEIAASVRRALEEAMQRAEASPLPDPDTLLENVYAESDELDAPHFR